MSSLDEEPLKSLKAQASHAYKRLRQVQIDGVKKAQQSLFDVHEIPKAIVHVLEAQVTRLELTNSELKTYHELRAQRAKLEDEVIDLKDKLYRVRLRNLLEYEKGDMEDPDFEPQLDWLNKQTCSADCLLDAGMMLHWGGLQGEFCEHVRDSFLKIYGMMPQQIYDFGE
ncbi:hypothetical protein N7448_003801 [Penicillium atrosanguineum]|uniref:Uncharacterized protein n=1 Tax=Penicillium atrosanguineum TaxID=1132637 RepID=A0A9W9PX51_9EURO|nr:hypothetical protein N7526_009605 [Penicillium atrosanguineum]KAJ5140393.1 hypothetical protein N7448_003801 [Penicillium atrosanguineum]KAJ5315825.1 hypothetical protein N7476_006132 [Penicillium atrosanguineum]